jgi:hypothetical protein
MIGQTVWVRGDGWLPKGRVTHWTAQTVTKETPLLWITNHGTKVPKKNPDRSLFLFSEEDVAEQEWLEDNRYTVSNAVLFCKDPAVLREIARLVGYKHLRAKP